jgi:hypothetical protein
MDILERLRVLIRSEDNSTLEDIEEDLIAAAREIDTQRQRVADLLRSEKTGPLRKHIAYLESLLEHDLSQVHERPVRNLLEGIYTMLQFAPVQLAAEHGVIYAMVPPRTHEGDDDLNILLQEDMEGVGWTFDTGTGSWMLPTGGEK